MNWTELGDVRERERIGLADDTLSFLSTKNKQIEPAIDYVLPQQQTRTGRKVKAITIYGSGFNYSYISYV